MSYPASEDGSPERGHGGAAGGAPGSVESAYFSGNSMNISSQEAQQRAEEGRRSYAELQAASRASLAQIEAAALAGPSPAQFGALGAGGWGAGGWGAGLVAPVPQAAPGYGGAAAAPGYGGAAAPQLLGGVFNPIALHAAPLPLDDEVVGGENDDGLASPVAEEPLDPCRLFVDDTETLTMLNYTKESFKSQANRDSILQKIYESSTAAAALPEAGAANKSGFEVLADKNHPYFFLALKTFIACFLLDGLGHDQIYGDDPNVKEMIQACISSYGDLLTAEYRAELKAAVLKKDGINDTNAKSTILALCKELRIALGIDNEPAKIEVTNDEMNAALDVMEGGAKGPKPSKKNPSSAKGTAKKRIGGKRGSSRIKLAGTIGSFQNTRKKRISGKKIYVKVDGQEKPSIHKSRGQRILEEAGQEYIQKEIEAQKQKQKKIKKERKKAIGKIAEALPEAIQALGEKAKNQLVAYYPVGGNDRIAYSIDSLTAKTWKGLVSKLHESGREQCVLNTASSRGDPASFNPTVWGPANNVSLATYTGTHTTRGAVGFPIYCESTQMTLLDPDTGLVRKELTLPGGRSMNAEFVSKGVTITEIKDLANAIRGLPTSWVISDGGSVYTKNIDGAPIITIRFTGEFTPSEKLVLGCGLKTDGDIGGLRFISGLQEENIEYEIQNYDNGVPNGEPVDGAITNLVTMTFDIICAELAATFSGQGVFKMKPSGEVHIIKPIKSIAVLTIELLQSLHRKIADILRGDLLPVWKVVASTAVELRGDLETLKEILALRRYLCDARELTKKINPSQKRSQKDKIIRLQEELGLPRTESLKSLIDRLAKNDAQERRADINTSIETFLRENDDFFSGKYTEYKREKNRSELNIFRRKGLTESGGRIYANGKVKAKNELTEQMNRFLGPILRASAPHGLAPFQDLMKDIYFDLTIEQLNSQIKGNLLHNAAFNDPLKILNANSYSALNKIYANVESFFKELCSFNTYWFELRNALLFLFSHKWDVNNKLKLYKELRVSFERQTIRVNSANYASLLICAYVFPLTNRELQSLQQEAEAEAAAEAQVEGEGEGEGEAEAEAEREGEGEGEGEGDGGEYVEGEGGVDEDDDSIWNELIDEDILEEEENPDPDVFKFIKYIYKEYILKPRKLELLDTVGSHRRIKKNFLIPYIRSFLLDSDTQISPAGPAELHVFGGGGGRSYKRTRKNSK